DVVHPLRRGGCRVGLHRHDPARLEPCAAPGLPKLRGGDVGPVRGRRSNRARWTALALSIAEQAGTIALRPRERGDHDTVRSARREGQAQGRPPVARAVSADGAGAMSKETAALSRPEDVNAALLSDL